MSNLPVPIDFTKYAGAGFENQTGEDISIPFIDVLQPTFRRNDPRTDVPPTGAAGDLFNTVTREVTPGSTGLVIIPCLTEHTFVEWAPRETGGGLVAKHSPSSPLVKEAKEKAPKFGKYTINGNTLTETFYIYALVLDGPDATEPKGYVVLSFVSTKISIYKRINTMLNTFLKTLVDGTRVRPPLFSHRLRVTTAVESRPQGTSFNYRIAPVNGSVIDSMIAHSTLLEAGEALRSMVSTGRAKAATEGQEAEECVEYSNS